MPTNILKTLVCLTTLIVLGQTLSTGAQPPAAIPKGKAAAEQKAATASKPRPVPYRGSIRAVDRTASTFTIGQRTFLVTKQTKMLRDGKTIELKDDLVGQWVTGSYRTNADAKLEVSTLYVGGKAVAEPKKGGKQSE